MWSDPLLPSPEDYLRRAAALKREMAVLPIGTAPYERYADHIARLESKAVEVRQMQARMRAASGDRRLDQRSSAQQLQMPEKTNATNDQRRRNAQ
jgi:hypothetical protein